MDRLSLLFLFLFLLLIKTAFGIGIAVSPDRLGFDLDRNREREFIVYNPNNFMVEYSFSAKYNKDLFEFYPDRIKIDPNSHEKIRISLNNNKIRNYDDMIYIKENSDNNLKTSIAIKIHIDKKRRDGKEFFILSLVLLGGTLLYYRNRKT